MLVTNSVSIFILTLCHQSPSQKQYFFSCSSKWWLIVLYLCWLEACLTAMVPNLKFHGWHPPLTNPLPFSKLPQALTEWVGQVGSSSQKCGQTFSNWFCGAPLKSSGLDTPFRPAPKHSSQVRVDWWGGGRLWVLKWVFVQFISLGFPLGFPLLCRTQCQSDLKISMKIMASKQCSLSPQRSRFPSNRKQ